MIIDAIRRHIEQCGSARYRIAEYGGVNGAQLCRTVPGRAVALEITEKPMPHFRLTSARQKEHRAGQKKERTSDSGKKGQSWRVSTNAGEE